MTKSSNSNELSTNDKSVIAQALKYMVDGTVTPVASQKPVTAQHVSLIQFLTVGGGD